MARRPTPAAIPAAIEQDLAPTIVVEDAPVRTIDSAALRLLGGQFRALFDRFASERIPVEQRWLRNLRQYMGVYDPELESQLAENRSRAYPRLTRMKCISMLSRLMNLMFPGNEENWELNASPSPAMSPETVEQAVTEMLAERQAAAPPPAEGQPAAPVPITQDLLEEAVRRLATRQAADLTDLLKDQLLELGGDQTIDWISLNRKVCDSGIKYGCGLLEGPFVRKVETSGWAVVGAGEYQPRTKTEYKPQFDHLPVWDFYPDMSSRTLPGEGYFVRKVLGRSALRKLADRNDFFGDQIKQVIINTPGGNYKAKSWETELRAMGTSLQADSNSSAQATGREKYEIIIWKGPISAQSLSTAGVEVPQEMMSDDVEAELWMVNNFVIKAEVNAWRKMGVSVRQIHIFNFDDDDTSPVSQGLPYVVRDSQLSICASTRMMLDNASVTCGPNLEVNTSLMRADQDITSVQPYKIWYRDDEGLTAQFPAVRRIEIDGHLDELQGLVRMFLEFAELETFIGPGTGGDMSKIASEPMRTAAGASMLRSDAALPFKDIVRNYDSFTQSVIWSLVGFNKKFNPDLAPEGDYDVIPRGATSLIAKEVRGQQIDLLSQTLTPEERDHIDERKFIVAKLAARDLQGMLVSKDEAEMRKSARGQAAAAQQEKQDRLIEAQIRDTLAGALKNVSQSQKNTAAADKVGIEAATTLMEKTGDGPANNQGA